MSVEKIKLRNLADISIYEVHLIVINISSTEKIYKSYM